MQYVEMGSVKMSRIVQGFWRLSQPVILHDVLCI